MSLDAVQVNKRIGLGQSSFGSKKIGSNTNTKTTGLSAQATRNLNGASIANKPSVFSFTQQSGYHRVYGSNAAKGRNQLNLERHRASLNAQNQGVRRSNADYTGGIIYAQGTQQQHHMSTLDKIGLGVQIGMQAFQLGAQLFGGVKNGAKIDQGMSSLGNGGSQIQMSSSGGQSAIAGMQSAQTSAELSSAIGSAQTQLAQMNSTAASGNFAAKANTAKTNMDTYKSDVSKSQTEVKKARQDVKTRQDSVRASSDMRDNSLRAVQLADSKYGAAAEAHAQAKDGLNQANQDLSNAKAALASTPKTDANGNPNPQYQIAETKVKEAEAAQAKAKTAEANAQKALDEADQARDKSNAQLNKAISDLSTAQDRLDTQKDIETTCKNTLIKTEADYKKSQETYQNAQDDVQKYLEFQQDTKQLQAEITKQQERLTKLQEKEEKQINKLNKKIDKGIKKNIKSNEGIDPNNGMNIRERYLQNNIERRNDKNASRIAQRDAIAANHV